MTTASRAALLSIAKFAKPHGFEPTEAAYVNLAGMVCLHPIQVIELLTALDRAEACVEAAREIGAGGVQTATQEHCGEVTVEKYDVDRLTAALAEYDAHSRSAGQAGETK